MPRANVVWPRGIFLTTANATPTTGWNFTTANNVSYHVRCIAVATDGVTTASYERVGTFENSNGVLTQVGTTTSIHTGEDIATPGDVNFVISGVDIIFQVIGDPGRTYQWAFYTNLYPSRVS